MHCNLKKKKGGGTQSRELLVLLLKPLQEKKKKKEKKKKTINLPAKSCTNGFYTRPFLPISSFRNYDFTDFGHTSRSFQCLQSFHELCQWHSSVASFCVRASATRHLEERWKKRERKKSSIPPTRKESNDTIAPLSVEGVDSWQTASCTDSIETTKL